MSRLVGAAVCAASAAITATILAAVTPLPVAFLTSAAIAGSVIAWALLDAAHDRTPPPPPPAVTDQSPLEGHRDLYLRLADHAEQRGDRKRARELRDYAKQAADTPRHLTNHVPLWRRVPSWRRLPQWVGLAGLLAGLLAAGGEHTAHLLADEPAQEHSHAAEPAAAPEIVVEYVEYSVPKACVDALDAATKGFDAASGHVSDMHDHIRDSGAATREHLPDMADSVNKIEKLHDRLDDAAKACEEADR